MINNIYILIWLFIFIFWYIISSMNKWDHYLQNIFINKNPENCSLCFYEFNYPNALKYKNFTRNISEFNAKIKEIQNPQLEMDDKNFDLVVVFGSIYMLGLVFKDFQDFFAAQNPD